MTARHSHPRTGDQTLVREINLSLILQQLREHAPLSRAGLAEATGLNKTTVSSLVQELIDNRLVHEIGYDSSGPGRPAMQLELNPQAGIVLSAEIQVDAINVIRTDFTAAVEWQRTVHTTHDMRCQQIVELTLTLLHEAADARTPQSGELLGLALGVPGLVDQSTGYLILAPNLGWHDVLLSETLRESFPDVPIYIDNEANFAALGEHFSGCAQAYDDVLYLSAGAGLGGGMIRAGQLFRGKSGFAGEFGHMTLDPQGQLCGCGSRGCWETLASESALYRYIQQAAEAGAPTPLSALTQGDFSQLTPRLVLKAAGRGDPVALAALEKVGRWLGVGAASLVNALDPELVVLGGSLSAAADYLLPPMRTEIAAHAIGRAGSPTEVRAAAHSADACVMGGVAAVIEHILTRPTSAGRSSD